MSVILQDYLTCANKDESLESIIKRLIAISSTGTLYLRTDAGIYLSGSNLPTISFTDADLVNVTIDSIAHRCYLLQHNFGTNSFDYVVKNNAGNTQFVAQSVINANSTYIIIDDTITGTWTIDAWTL